MGFDQPVVDRDHPSILVANLLAFECQALHIALRKFCYKIVPPKVFPSTFGTEYLDLIFPPEIVDPKPLTQRMATTSFELW